MKNQEQLIRSIEQRIEVLSFIDEDLAYQFECDLYYETDDNDVPIVELFNQELLEELNQLIESYKGGTCKVSLQCNHFTPNFLKQNEHQRPFRFYQTDRDTST